jgi:error-prone DNA polymerase
MERHRERLITRMQAKGIAAEFAEKVFEQIRGFGEYGFPESHAASFALIAYATAWLKCYYPAEFACSLLNAQPMGFYAPATIVDDAKRHGIIVRAIDVAESEWDCTLEPLAQSTGGYALRMGLRYVKGLVERDWQKIARARRETSFLSLDDFVRRFNLDESILSTLAEAGAFETFGYDRRSALWQVRRLVRARKDSLPVPPRERGARRAWQEANEAAAFAIIHRVAELMGADIAIREGSLRGAAPAPLRDVEVISSEYVSGVSALMRTRFFRA